MNKLAVMLLVLLISSCGMIPPREPVTIKELLPIGATLQLTQELLIPAQHSYVYIQAGRIAPFKAYNSVNIYQPYCMFRMHESTTKSRRVAPDRFLVTQVVEWEDYIGRLDSVKLAGLTFGDRLVRPDVGGGLGFMGLTDDGGPSIIMYATIISLHSEKQPDVKELVCGHWDDQGIVEPLTLEEMKIALGDLILIQDDTSQ